MPMFRQWRVIIGLVAIIVVATVAISAILPVAAAPRATTTPTKVAATATPLTLPTECATATTLCPLAITLVNQLGQMQLSNQMAQKPQADTAFAFGTVTTAKQIFVSGNDVNIVLALLNPTNTPEIITTVELRVVSFTPFYGSIPNAFAACDLRAFANGTAKPPTKVAGHDCNLNTSPSITHGFPVSLSTKVSNGIVIPLDSGVTNQGQLTSSPIVVPPYATSNGATSLLNVAITPNLSGTYVFQVGVAIRGHALTFFDTTLSALAVTQEAINRYWSAENCSMPDNRWQVPASGAYLCPGPVATE
ncbi:MAG: hypothetical protein H0X24_17740 [Ktedonobacterales bacterium]|nr:hypothetical protein [Ktedonobacterales bacterium]